MFIFRNTGGKCNNFWQSGHEGGDHSFGIQRTHKRRTVSGIGLCINTERPGRHRNERNLGTPTGVGVALSHEADHSAGGEAGSCGVTHARAAPTAGTMH